MSAVILAVLILAAVLVVILILVLIVILVVVLVLIVVLVTVLIVVLIVHKSSSGDIYSRSSAPIDCPIIQVLSLSLKNSPASSPAKTAAAMPPAQAFSPPVKMPRKPSLCTASLTPLARL